MRNQIAAGINHRDIHRLANLFGPSFRGDCDSSGVC
jgi:hypothetical protein